MAKLWESIYNKTKKNKKIETSSAETEEALFYRKISQPKDDRQIVFEYCGVDQAMK